MSLRSQHLLNICTNILSGLQTHLECWYFNPTAYRADQSEHLRSGDRKVRIHLEIVRTQKDCLQIIGKSTVVRS